MPTDVILETDGLTKEFRGFVAVKDVTLRVRRGSIHALIGPNGAGKTTCFNLLTHFLVPTRGRITFNGRDITGSRPADIARQGLVRPGHAEAAGTYRLDLLGPGVHQRDLVPRPGEEAAEIAADRACADEEQSWTHGDHDIRLRGPNATAIIGRR